MSAGQPGKRERLAYPVRQEENEQQLGRSVKRHDSEAKIEQRQQETKKSAYKRKIVHRPAQVDQPLGKAQTGHGDRIRGGKERLQRATRPPQALADEFTRELRRRTGREQFIQVIACVSARLELNGSRPILAQCLAGKAADFFQTPCAVRRSWCRGRASR